MAVWRTSTFRGYLRGQYGQETDFAKSVALELIGAEQVDLERPWPWAKTSPYMLEKKPGCYLFIGNGSIGSKGGNTIHNPNYDFNDDNVAIGCAYWYLLAKRYLVPL